MATTENAKPTPWIGFHRGGRRLPWRAVVEAADEATCWNLLLDRAPPGGEKSVLPSCRHPNDRHLSSTTPETHR